MNRKLIIAIATLLILNKAHSQFPILNGIAKILDTTQVTFSSTELAMGSLEDLRPFMPRFFEFSSIDKKFDSVTHGYGKLQIGKIMKCDSVVSKNGNLNVYISSKKVGSKNSLIPLDLIVGSKHYDRSFLMEFFSKISFSYSVPITQIIVFIDVISEGEINIFKYDSIPTPPLVASRYAILFTYELVITSGIKKNWTISDIKDHSTELYNAISRFYPTAMMVYPSDVVIEYGLGTRDRKKMIELVKAKVETYMKLHFAYLGNKFISDGQYKYTFKSIPGEITKQNNFWEYFEILIIYTPYDEHSGQFMLTFDGRYKQAKAGGKGPNSDIIKTEGTPLEEKYRDEVNSYLNLLANNLKTMLNHERTKVNKYH